MSDSQPDRTDLPEDGLDIDLSDPVNRDHPLNQGRAAWWLTLPGWYGGATWNDLMGPDPAALTSMSNTANGFRSTDRPGGFGHVLFDGSAGYAAPPAGPALAVGGGPFTLSAWIRTTTTGAYQTILRSDPVGGSAYAIFRVENTNALRWYLLSGAADDISSPGSVADGAWHHAVATQSAAAHAIYLDGIQVATAAATAATFTNQTWFIGASGGTAEFFSGPLDDLSIWSRALSASDVSSLYGLSRRGYPGVLNRY